MTKVTLIRIPFVTDERYSCAQELPDLREDKGTCDEASRIKAEGEVYV